MKRFGYHVNRACRACGGEGFETVLELGAQPPSNAFLRPDEVAHEQRFPLTLMRCRACELCQLLDVVHGADVFAEYPYLSSTSGALRAHFAEMVRTLLATETPPPGALVVDVGANDGVTLDAYPVGPYRLLGVEPSSAGEHARAKGHTIEAAFFDRETAERLVEQHGRAHLVTASNVAAHVDDMLDFLAGFQTLLSDEGAAVIEVSYLPDLIDGGYFDTIYHEHLCYWALSPFVRAASRAGLRVVEAERVPFGASGPAMRVKVVGSGSTRSEGRSVAALLSRERAWGLYGRDRYLSFARRTHETLDELRRIIDQRVRSSGPMFGFAAPAKGNTLLNSLGVGPNQISALAENNPHKVGMLAPGSHIPVIDDATLLERGPDEVLLLAWNYADAILRYSPLAARGARFLVPLPKPTWRTQAELRQAG